MTGPALHTVRDGALAAGLDEALSGQDPVALAGAAAAVVLVVVAMVVRAVSGRSGRRSPTRRPGARPSERTTRTRPQVGDVWWADVPFEDGTGSKDRPVVVVETHGYRCVGLYVTSTDKAGRPGWLAMPRQGWSPRPGTSWLRTDRRVVLDGTQLRRYAGPCPTPVRKALRV